MQFSQMTADQLNHIATGQKALQDALSGVDATGASEREGVSAAGACDPMVPITELTVSGTKAYTLADGRFAGQKKRIVCVSAASTPLGTLTIATPEATVVGQKCGATFVFDTAGQALDLVWSATGWRAQRVQRAGMLAVTPGTTVLTGFALALNYSCAVTGTVAGTGTGGLPNGSAVGERCIVTCSTAASTPIGSLDGVFKDLLGAAATHLGAIGVVASASVVGDICVLEWDGAAWQVIYLAGVTLS
jgi:hypothetical protein